MIPTKEEYDYFRETLVYIYSLPDEFLTKPLWFIQNHIDCMKSILLGEPAING